MNKITKKLFRYFTMLALFLVILVFIGFYSAFRFYDYRFQKDELKERARTIKTQLETFMTTTGPHRGQGAYLRFLDDISMADTYIISRGNEMLFCGNYAAPEKEPSKKILTIAEKIFVSGQEQQLEEHGQQGEHIIYLGFPVKRNKKPIVAVVIRDTLSLNQDSFLLSITILGCCLLFALAMSGFLSAFLSRRFLIPIQKIAAATRELAQGNYQVETKVYDKNEIGVLARETDILAEKLRAARRESEALEQMQKDYIANISHELRTPVTVIRSSLEAVCDGVVSGDKLKEYQEQSLKESISLQRLVNDMLELSRLQNKEFPIERSGLDLLMVLDDALRATRIIARNKNMLLHYNRPKTEWCMKGDYGRLRQMFTAALDNAIKYSPNDSNVWIQTWETQGEHGISIKDEGCGIPEDEQEHIFEKFFRSQKTKEKGSGLGLAIMKNIADRHSIVLKIRSVYGQGTEVIFIVPDIPFHK